ncbi:MAG: hypothetical protein ACREFZ_05035 [Acetobacteraceae bacterium]
MAMLLVGSFGKTWTNTLLPHGVTLHWYTQLLGDPSFRHAFQVSLEVTSLTCVAVTLLATPLAYALYASAGPPRIKASPISSRKRRS